VYVAVVDIEASDCLVIYTVTIFTLCHCAFVMGICCWFLLKGDLQLKPSTSHLTSEELVAQRTREG